MKGAEQEAVDEVQANQKKRKSKNPGKADQLYDFVLVVGNILKSFEQEASIERSILTLNVNKNLVLLFCNHSLKTLTVWTQTHDLQVRLQVTYRHCQGVTLSS